MGLEKAQTLLLSNDEENVLRHIDCRDDHVVVVGVEVCAASNKVTDDSRSCHSTKMDHMLHTYSASQESWALLKDVQ